MIEIKLIGIDEIRTRRRKTLKDSGEVKKGGLDSEEELTRFAQGIIDERTEFCAEYKKDEPLDKCVCEGVIRWIKLYETSHIGSKKLGKLRVAAVEKLFSNMVKEGKLKC